MAGIDERAVARVDLDGQSAENRLSSLTERAKEFRKEMADAVKENNLDKFKKLEKSYSDIEKQIREAKKTTFDYNQVLKNLSGSTIKDLERTQSMLTKEIKNTTRGTDEYIKKTRQLSQVRSEISKTRGDMNQFTTTQGKLTGILTKAVGLVGGFYGAIKIGEAIINSSEAASDKWAVTMGGLGSALDYIKKSISTMDFSNFFKNIGNAIKAGEEYARQLDEIEDRNRAAAMRESEIKLEIAQQTNIYKDVLRTDKERVAAIDKILSLEKEMIGVRRDIAKQSWNAKIQDIEKLGITEKTVIANLRNYEANKNIIKQADAYNALISERNLLESLAKSESKSKALEEINEKILASDKSIVEFAKLRSKYTDLDKKELDQLVDLYVQLYNTETAYYEDTSRAAAKKSQLLKEIYGDPKKAGNEKLGEENPLYTIGKWQSDELHRELDTWVQQIKDAMDQASLEIEAMAIENKGRSEQNQNEIDAMQLHHIKTNEEYARELYEQTLEGKKELLKKQLDQGFIAEKEYQDQITELNKEHLSMRLQSINEMLTEAQEVFRRHTIAYRVAAATEAAIATYAGAAKELDSNDPYWLKIIKIALVIAKGLALVAKIQSAGNNSGYYGGGETGSGSDHQPAGVVHKNEYVINARQMRDPKIKGIVHNYIEPDRVAHLNFSGAQSAVSNIRGYASGGFVTQPTPVNNINLNTQDLAAQASYQTGLLARLVELMEAGKIHASFGDPDVEKITKRQTLIDKIKLSVSRTG